VIASASQPPLVLHLIHVFDVGGLENGLVNLINHAPPGRYRHAIACATRSSDFRKRIRRDDVRIVELGKRPGHDLGVYARFWKVLRELRPAILHSRNIGTLEYQFIAALAGVPGRIHGEHGWDSVDLHGTNPRYRQLRRLSRFVVKRYIPMSRHLERWLTSEIGIPAAKVRQVYNGVDIERFSPPPARELLPLEGFDAPGNVIVGSVGRLVSVKNQRLLAEAFVRLARRDPARAASLRLVIVGEGPDRVECERIVRSAGLERQCWITGMRDDVARLMRCFDVFALTSLNEGISNTILEAMATGLPVVATKVGGNGELVRDGDTGALCELENVDGLAEALGRYAFDRTLAQAHGAAGRQLVEREFSLQAMVRGYLDVYEQVLTQHTNRDG
jgi:sugar transferase (PEP-CTERM/EpsH1 system associated)